MEVCTDLHQFGKTVTAFLARRFVDAVAGNQS